MSSYILFTYFLIDFTKLKKSQDFLATIPAENIYPKVLIFM